MNRRGRSWRGLLGGVALMAPAALAGCGGDEGHLPVYPVKGEIRLNDEPADGAAVVFHPIAGEAAGGDKKSGDPIRPNAIVKADGSFELSTYEKGDGAPEGEYAVTVEWRKLVKTGGDVAAGPNVIPNDYAQAASTPVKVKVGQAPTTIDPIKIAKDKKRK